MKTLDILTTVLLIVGGLNWGLVGLLNFDLVATLFGSLPFLQNAVYTLVGLAAVYQIFGWRRIRAGNAAGRLAEVRG